MPLYRSAAATALAALALFGCGAKSGSGGSASASSTAAATATTVASASSSAKPADSATAAATASASVDVSDLVKDDHGGKGEGVLSVDLSQAKDDAPALGGEASKPPPAPKSGKLEWLSAGPLMIPNPGWKLSKHKDVGILVNPEGKGAVLFTNFTTDQDAKKKVDSIIDAWELKNMEWKKAEAYRIGPDKIPALIGAGAGKTKSGGVSKVFYALIRTGQKENLLAMGGAPASADESFRQAIRLVVNIKRK